MNIAHKARSGKYKQVTLKTYLRASRISHEELINFGEPYFVDGIYRNLACIKLFGPPSYWENSSSSFPIFGVAVDPEDPDYLKHILDARRSGEIYGKWFSQFCPEGEYGFLNYRIASKICANDFNLRIRELSNVD